LRILTTSLLLVSSLALSGCASLSLFGEREKPVKVITEARDRTPLAIPDPEPLRSRPMRWVLITPANQQEIFERMHTDGEDLVLFALTADGYQQLAMNIADLRNLLATQRAIIAKYREYYEPDAK
jgi:hypothetical protein